MQTQISAVERRQLRGTHVLIYAGNGMDRSAELLFSSGSDRESFAVHDLINSLMAKRLGLRETV